MTFLKYITNYRINFPIWFYIIMMIIILLIISIVGIILVIIFVIFLYQRQKHNVILLERKQILLERKQTYSELEKELRKAEKKCKKALEKEERYKRYYDSSKKEPNKTPREIKLLKDNKVAYKKSIFEHFKAQEVIKKIKINIKKFIII